VRVRVRMRARARARACARVLCCLVARACAQGRYFDRGWAALEAVEKMPAVTRRGVARTHTRTRKHARTHTGKRVCV
jgi:hypothetical protein